MNMVKQLRDGLFFRNLATAQLLGICSVTVTTITLFSGLDVGLPALVILALSNVIIAALCKIILSNIRIVCFTVVIASSVTIVDLCLQAFILALSKSLGLFIPLITVNCIILSHTEPFAYKNDIGASALDGIFQSLGYIMVLVIICVIHKLPGDGTTTGGLLEIGAEGQLALGSGIATGIRILPEDIPAPGMIPPAGGFPTLACVIVAMQHIPNKPGKGDKKTEEVTK